LIEELQSKVNSLNQTLETIKSESQSHVEKLSIDVEKYTIQNNQLTSQLKAMVRYFEKIRFGCLQKIFFKEDEKKNLIADTEYFKTALEEKNEEYKLCDERIDFLV
jgi:hypothetical protein